MVFQRRNCIPDGAWRPKNLEKHTAAAGKRMIPVVIPQSLPRLIPTPRPTGMDSCAKGADKTGGAFMEINFETGSPGLAPTSLWSLRHLCSRLLLTIPLDGIDSLPGVVRMRLVSGLVRFKPDKFDAGRLRIRIRENTDG